MNKRLFLLRHAQTLPSGEGGDKARRLSPKGEADARALGALMRKKTYMPEVVLCSPALRTRQTFEGVARHFEHELARVEFPDALYNAPEEELLWALREISDEVSSVLIVAHNPGIHVLAARLAQENAPALMNRLTGGYAPGTLTVLERPEAAGWADIRAGENPLLDLLDPLDYNAPATPARWT
ncbi:MAG: histidine phosphatase family protein [Alphaproteobacteria bacterium]|nr:histidine phosphatase family protein [Alphaproteobacteria bacterium]